MDNEGYLHNERGSSFYFIKILPQLLLYCQISPVRDVVLVIDTFLLYLHFYGVPEVPMVDLFFCANRMSDNYYKILSYESEILNILWAQIGTQ